MNAITLVKWLEPVDSDLERHNFNELSLLDRGLLTNGHFKILERPRVNYKPKFVEIYRARMCVNVGNIMKEKIDLTKHQIVLRQCVHQANLERKGIHGRLFQLMLAIVNPWLRVKIVCNYMNKRDVPILDVRTSFALQDISKKDRPVLIPTNANMQVINALTMLFVWTLKAGTWTDSVSV